MAPDAGDCEQVERVNGDYQEVPVHQGRRILPEEPPPAQAWTENEEPVGDSRTNSPGENRRLLGSKPPQKSACRLQAGLTLGVWGVKKPKCSSIKSGIKTQAKTKFQKRREKLQDVLRPPYFIITMLFLIVVVHFGPAAWRAQLEWAPGAWWLQPWRLLTYGLVHAGAAHLALNALVALAVGWRLESEQGWSRVALVWLGGVAAGALGAGALQPHVRVVGASAAVYALLTAHLPNVCLRWVPYLESEQGWSRVALVWLGGVAAGALGAGALQPHVRVVGASAAVYALLTAHLPNVCLRWVPYLESEQGWSRVALVWLGGVAAGALGAGALQPHVRVVGASAAVYALLTAHLPNVCLRWVPYLESEQGWSRVALVWLGGVAAGALGAGALQPHVRVVGASAAVYALLTAHLPNVCLRWVPYLESEQGWSRVALVWLGGVAAGALGAGALQPHVRVVGASAAVYALLTAHLPNVCLRFGHIPLWWFRPLSVVVLGASEGCWALLRAPDPHASFDNVAWAAHALGAAVGVPLAFLVFTGENLAKRSITVCRVSSALLLLTGVLAAIAHYVFWYEVDALT